MNEVMRRIGLFTLIVLTGCDPGYNCYIENYSKVDVFLRTSPSIESLYDQRSIQFESISHYRVGQDGELSLYRVRPGDQFRLYGHIGLKPNVKEVPFKHVEIIHGRDTVVLDSKEEILARLKQIRRSKSYVLKF
jgi:hypothetical protein